MHRLFRRHIKAGEVFMVGGFAVAAVVTVLLVVPPAAPSPQAAASLQGWVTTSAGPLGPADRDLLVKVRQAGLWEIPTGQQALQRGQSKRVKEVAMHLIEDHTKLDEVTRQVADRLNVVLPSQASPDQQRWMAQLSTVTGSEYDRVFAQLLRAAHGKVFAVVATVRAGTRNDEIRTFAQRGVSVVLKHMTLLESTGLVDYSALPEAPPPPSPAPAAAESRRENP